ncbi:MAG: thioester domain-containing protein [Bacilli bacterium]|nr:thioester domain-containing protein [Bacilli bacterium]
MKKIFLLVLGISFFGLFSGNVFAANISYERIGDAYYNLTVNGKYESNHVTKFILDGRLAYCIEPGADITTRVYDSNENWNASNVSIEKQIYLEKVGHFGYEYSGHNTDRYYLATQELIWKAFDNVDIYWTTGSNGTGERIDLSKEKNEILSLIKKYDTKPSFANSTLKGQVGTNLSIKDDNEVIGDFTISDGKYHNVSIVDNSLSISFSPEVNEEAFTITRKNPYGDLLLVYTKSGSQALASLRISTPLIYSFKVKSVEVPKEEVKKPTIEVVKVPSTLDDKRIRFNVNTYHINDFRRFN